MPSAGAGAFIALVAHSVSDDLSYVLCSDCYVAASRLGDPEYVRIEEKVRAEANQKHREALERFRGSNVSPHESLFVEERADGTWIARSIEQPKAREILETIDAKKCAARAQTAPPFGWYFAFVVDRHHVAVSFFVPRAPHRMQRGIA